ncbi:MAG: hypothetical protein AAFR61_01450 [Bacteroidota bacterium]
MAWKNLKRIEKIIVIAFVNLAIILLGFWLLEKKPNRDYFIPKEYAGWVIIKYNVANAPELPEKDGVLQIIVGEDGYLETSSSLDIGWRRDRFFWLDDNQETPIPTSVEKDGAYHIYLHRHKYYARSHLDMLGDLPVGTDTVLWDGTIISKESQGQVNYNPGKKTLEYFYLSAEAEPLTFNPPEMENNQALENTDDREIKLY